MHAVQPNAEQKRWREAVRDLGMGEIIHHAIDRTMKIKGVGNIGHWWLIPCTDDAHHRNIHALGKDRKPYEKARFEQVVRRYVDLREEKPPLPDGVFEAIMGFRR